MPTPRGHNSCQDHYGIDSAPIIHHAQAEHDLSQAEATWQVLMHA